MKQNLYYYKAMCERVIDGDTIVAKIKIGFELTTKQQLRILGIDTAELNSSNEEERELANKAKEFVKEQIEGKEIFVKTHKTDSFGRYLADVFVEDESTVYDLGGLLLTNGLAREYK